MILAPQNAFYILEAAETAYSAADIPLALKFYLRVVEMLDEPPSSGTTPSRPEGPTLRAWYGVKLVSPDRHLNVLLPNYQTNHSFITVRPRSSYVNTYSFAI